MQSARSRRGRARVGRAQSTKHLLLLPSWDDEKGSQERGIGGVMRIPKGGVSSSSCASGGISRPGSSETGGPHFDSSLGSLSRRPGPRSGPGARKRLECFFTLASSLHPSFDIGAEMACDAPPGRGRVEDHATTGPGRRSRGAPAEPVPSDDAPATQRGALRQDPASGPPHRVARAWPPRQDR